MTGSLKEKMFGGALWAGAGKLLSMGSSFLLTLALARALVPAEYGTYFVALNTIVVLASVGTLGLDRVVVRFVAMRAIQHDTAGMRQVVWRCLGLVAAGGLTTAVAFKLLAPGPLVSILHMPDLVGYLGLLAAWILSATMQRQLAETFRGLNDIRWATLFGGVRSSGILNSMIACAAVLLLWVGGQLSLFTALLVMLGTSIFVVVVASIVLWRRLRAEHGHADAPAKSSWSAKTALLESAPLWFATLIVAFNTQGVAWLASAFDSPDRVALFGVAQRFVLLLMAPMIVINAVLPPIIAQLHSSDQLRRLQHVVRSFGGLILLPSLVLLIFLVAAGQPLLRMLFGAYYEASYPILLLLCAGQVVNIATGAWQIVMPMTGSKRQLLASTVVSMLTLLLLGIALGSRLGVLGVAIAFCVSTITTNLVGMLLVRRELGIWTFASLNVRTMLDARDMLVARLKRGMKPRGATS